MIHVTRCRSAELLPMVCVGSSRPLHRRGTALLLPLPLPLLLPPFPEPYEAPRASVFFASPHSFLAPRELETCFRTFSPRPANQCHPLRATGARRPCRRLKAENQSAEQTSEAS
eukprot:CAMPEP_0198678974 /NCGR_PEP_ID=MMETSP1468-20131203/1845_1 /TAXON_ID=1461545 /ORGANISM="Mantoniella sp, Strain CCMP1436" /LENGTH=113 /DNA_ID=CAMNT_0044417049 /DNA_START=162 /DNA_END=499 /DNA_ORIENTATION=+